MKLIKPKGSTDVSVQIFVMDTTSTVGAGKTGLAFNTSGLSLYYCRVGGTPTSITLVTQTVTGAHADGGFVQLSATYMPGWYRIDLPDACFAAGADSVGFTFRDTGGTNNIADVSFEVQLDVHETIEDQVLNAAMSGHDVAGTMGELLNDLLDFVGTSGVEISTAKMNAIADAVLSRDLDNVEDTAPVDSLLALALRHLYWSVSGTTLTIQKTTGSQFMQKTLATLPNADPITGVS